MREPPRIDVREWLADLLRVGRADGEGFTRQDLEDATGWSEQTASEWMRRWGRMGLVECVGRVQRPRMDGLPSYRPVYRITKKIKKEPKARR